MKSLITINNDSIRIRPSAVESFFACGFAWGKTFLEGVQGGANSRASIGTAIHAGVEQMWNESISANKKVANISAMTDAAMDAWKEDTSDGVLYGDKETEGSCALEIIKGTEAFVEDIVPFTRIPKAVETFYKIDIPDHPIVSELGGTIDYLSGDTIADVKTSKRKSGPEGHTVQQSIYKYLANENGAGVKHNLIQQVVLKKEPEGAILPLEADIPQAKYLLNLMLDTLELVAKDIVPIETILRPNNKHMFCSMKFCPHYASCPAIKGNLKPAADLTKIKL